MGRLTVPQRLLLLAILTPCVTLANVSEKASVASFDLSSKDESSDSSKAEPSSKDESSDSSKAEPSSKDESSDSSKTEPSSKDESSDFSKAEPSSKDESSDSSKAEPSSKDESSDSSKAEPPSKDESSDSPKAEGDSEIAVPAVLEEIVKVIRSELENKKYQPVVAALAFVFGCVLVFDGELCLHLLIASTVFVVVGSIAMNQVSSSWNSHEDSFLRYIVGLEAGCVGAFAALKGMDGMRVSVGAALGILAALKLEEFLDERGVHVISSHRWIEVVYFSVIGIGSALLLYKNKHLKLLAVLSAGLGAAFCSSAIAFTFTTLAARGYLPFLNKACPDLTPKTGTWVEFFEMLWSPKTSSVLGIFADSKYNPKIEGKDFSLDKMADYCLWLGFWLVGSVVQLRRLRRANLPKLPVQEPLLGELPK
eukprot:Skav229981  [mRNA]  locus=scaffold1837:5892:7160:+ [translate_table: standard]